MMLDGANDKTNPRNLIHSFDDIVMKMRTGHADLQAIFWHLSLFSPGRHQRSEGTKDSLSPSINGESQLARRTCLQLLTVLGRSAIASRNTTLKPVQLTPFF
jgi:hypothetical protein